MNGIAILAVPLLALSPLAVYWTSPTAQEKSLQKEAEVRDEEIDGWVRDLSSLNFDEREIATQKILDLGSRALPFLEKAVKSSKDSEVRWNAKRLIREIRESARPAPPAPRRPEFGAGPEGRIEDLVRQMERQQEEMRRLLEERLGRAGEGGGMGHSYSLRQGPDGIRLEVVEMADGREERKIYEAKSLEEFQEKYPEIVERYGIGGAPGGGMRFHFRAAPRREGFPGEKFRLRSFRPETEVPLSHERLGVEIDTLEPSLSAFLDLPEGIGLLVRRVEKGSLAERMGVREKDVLLRINEKDVRGRETILATLRELSPGAAIELEVSRFGAGKMALRGTKEAARDPKPLERAQEESK